MIAWFATKGSGTNEARRIESLLAGVEGTREMPFDKAAKARSFFALLAAIRRERPRLLVMEGTGLAGGLACLWSRLRHGVPFIVSSGDAVGPFVGSHRPGLGGNFGLYERALCRLSAGFIGWTPYLTGRALTFGAPRAITAPGWMLGGAAASPEARSRTRERLGIPADHLVLGIVGALEWNDARQYCYGLELVRAIQQIRRPDISVLVIGGGSGLERLRALAGADLGRRVFLPGPVPLEAVMDHLAALDVASLPQSMDRLGMFRYTTKISEYAAARLPVVTSRLPMAYDLDGDWMWRLRGAAPWDETYLQSLTALIEALTPAQIAAKAALIPARIAAFDADAQARRVSAFLNDLLEDFHAHPQS